MVTRVTVKSKYGNLNGGYIANGGSHDGKPVYLQDAKGSQTVLFHESRFGGTFWYFGPKLPAGRAISSFISSTGDAASPDRASWPDGDIEAIEDATHAVDHSSEEAKLFHDSDFTHDSRSIGSISSRAGRGFTPQWIPVRFLRRGRWKLFDGIEASDLLQGSLGNCWFVAALAAMAEFPREVQKLFVDATDITKGGRYTIRLFDHKQDKLTDIVIDEFIPCHPKSWWDPHGVPLFAKPNGNEAWVLLLEKAMAKMFGSYSALDGNNAAVAFRALTGEKKTYMWKKDRTGTWTKWMISNRSTSFHCNALMPERKGDDDMFTLLLANDSSNFLMSASLEAKHAMEHERKDGLVEGHAYSLLQVLQREDQKLLCMRNPWGNHVQWKGAWCDGDSIWTRFPRLRADLRPEFKEDGIFWMSWDDFRKRWDSVVVCAKSMREGEAAKAHSHYSATGKYDIGLSSVVDPRRPGKRPPPLGSMRLPATTGDPINCPGKHGLLHSKGHFDCDLCHRSTGTEKSDVYSCRTCDYDVCARCVARAPAGYEKARPSASDAPGADPRSSAATGEPTSAADPPSADKAISCPGKHDLSLDRVPHKGFTCDVCGRPIKTFSHARSCRICDFDACMECCSKGTASSGPAGKGEGKGRGEAAAKGKGYPSKKPCENGCGRPAFGSFATCCNRCQGTAGPHARDCAAKAGLAPAEDSSEADAKTDGTRTADSLPFRAGRRRAADKMKEMGIDPGFLMFESFRVRAVDVDGEMNPCEHGCGRPAFGKFPTCCTRCKGPEGPHARDCEVKAGLSESMITTDTRVATV